ncbi:cytochrome-c oxidase, subunit VIIa [Acaromyces ingoldii]|uniref:Cytochrome c oxidase subunit 9, mitochondrial n=1 Tax=Acaromyces ingoldii TaxID=215250 RepID=A0A316YYK2_9BASI|nr:cytochrome-c oxidase, subunit VIIa [Acaromyces ingoldii]PWN93844.1 cytochrome-c oxidase, subunit VIIa [Acaromyces ingoldii]
MPVAQLPAITGKLRKRLILDLSVALGGGTVAGYGYWYGVHLPSVQRRDNYYAKLQSEGKQA